MAAGHPVSPSDAVDQAWHLHLIYSRSYWDEFCAKTLLVPLHHGPTRGGGKETSKHESWYADTVASYERFFGTRPPVDVWPPVSERFGRKDRHVRVNLRESWVIRKPRRPWLTLAGLTGFLLASCGPVMGPFDLPGKQFLTGYIILIFLGICTSAFLRWYFRGGAAKSYPTNPLDPYETAYLAGGGGQVVDALLAKLYSQGHLKADEGTSSLVAGTPLPADAHSLEVAALERIGAGCKVGKVRKTLLGLKMPTERLYEQGLLLRHRLARYVPSLVMAIILSIGVVKIWVGLQRNAPVSWLVLFCLGVFVVNLVFLFKSAFRSREGDFVLDEMRRRNAQLRSGVLYPQYANGETHAMAVALFGVGVLSAGSLPYYRDLFPNKPQRAEGGSGCSSSGCSSSGCTSSGCTTSGCTSSGGSGCGSGCGGGGGCGGCGGGGD